MRLVLFGDGRWAADTLDRLLDDGHAVAAAVLRARPSDDALERAARARGVPLLQPPDVNAAACVRSVRALSPEVNLSVAYDQIFGPSVRATAPWFLNVHAGQLPRYRGRNVINWAIINGERDIGVTLHVVDEGVDTGPVLLQRLLPIGWTDGYGDVLARVVAAVPSLVADGLAAIAAGRAQLQAQPPVGTYFSGRRTGDEWLDWGRPSIELYNKIRGITRPGPGARTWHDGDTVVVWRAALDPEWPAYIATPGEVVGRERGRGVFVKTGTSILLLQEVECGSRGVEIPSWPIGTRLGIDVAEAARDWLTRANRLQGTGGSDRT
jgi:methionyl-tRNA formyltransferase